MRIPLLALALLATSTAAFAQSDSPPYGETDNPVPGSKLASPSIPNPDFPLHVWLRVRGNTWNGSYEYYSGHGRFQISPTDAATTPKPVNFEYECGYTFLNPKLNQFQARWVKPNKTLQILLYDPDRPSKPRTCNLNALAQPLQKIPRGLRQNDDPTSNPAVTRPGQTPAQPPPAPSPLTHP
jgi:hypothetical protein